MCVGPYGSGFVFDNRVVHVLTFRGKNQVVPA